MEKNGSRLLDKKDLLYENSTFDVIEGIGHMRGQKKLYTMIFTNGTIIKTGDKETYDVSDLANFGHSNNGKKVLDSSFIKYYPILNTIEVNHIKVENADYVIKVLVAEQFLRGTRSAGFFHVIQDKEIYLKNPRDRETKKCVKEILKMLNEQDIELLGFKYSKIDFDEKEEINVPVRRKTR